MKILFEKKGYKLLSDKYLGNKEPLTFEKDGYLFQNTYNGFIKTNNPKKWGINNPYSLYNLNLYFKKEKVDCRALEYNFSDYSAKLKCGCGNKYTVSINNLISKKQYYCPQCGHKRGASKQRNLNLYLSGIRNKHLKMLGEYKGCKDYYSFITDDGYFIRTSPYNILNGKNERDTIFDASNKYSIDNMHHYIYLHHPNLKLLSNKYTSTKNKYKFKCSCGNEFYLHWQYITNINHASCPECSRHQSSLEFKVEKWLVDNSVIYEKEKTFDGCVDIMKLRFDFFLPNYNIVIECDGEQHYKEVKFGGNNSKRKCDLNKVKLHDKIKNEYCECNNIKIIRIPYYYFNDDKYKEILKTSIS